MKTKVLFLVISVIFFSGCSLAGSSSDGGVFRSDDGGKSFAQKAVINEKAKISSADILSLAVNSQNGNEAYIGTKSSGMFKTANSADTWQPLKISETTPVKAYAIAVDPVDPNTVYVAAVVDGRGKILKSTDAGANWKDVYTEAADGSLVLALALNPHDPKKIFAGTSKKQIIFSDNGGDTWKNLHHAGGEVFKISIDSADPNLAYFAVFQRGILRTKDGGATFGSLDEKRNFNSQLQLFENPRLCWPIRTAGAGYMPEPEQDFSGAKTAAMTGK